jgi:hypothetical protein
MYYKSPFPHVSNIVQVLNVCKTQNVLPSYAHWHKLGKALMRLILSSQFKPYAYIK